MILETLLGWAAAVERSGAAVAVREQAWPYPAANLIHVIGIALLVGAILALDLRLLGVRRNAVSAEGAAALLVPVAVVGGILAVPSGVMLFMVDAVTLTSHPLMQAKAGLLLLGLLNAVLFHTLGRRRRPRWDGAPPPMGVAQAAVSTLIWLGAVACGRLVAYV